MALGKWTPGVLPYDDDIVLVARDGETAQRMLDITSHFGRDFGARFSQEESSVVGVNGDEHDEGRTWLLVRMKIHRVKEYKYLANTLADTGPEKAKRENTTKTRQWWGRLAGMSRYRDEKQDFVVFFSRDSVS